jgi:hypothetical protein
LFPDKVGKIKVKLSLCLTKHHAVKVYSLTSALDGGEWSASHPGRFTPRERAPGTHWIGGCVGPVTKIFLDDIEIFITVVIKY